MQTQKIDPLLECLRYICKIEQKPFSAQAVSAGLPLVEGGLTPSLFIRAAEKVGFNARVVERKLKKISNLVLPCVLILNDNNAVLLTKIFNNGDVEILLPESGGGAKTISAKELNKEYTGLAIYVQPEYYMDDRAKEFLPESKESWFWGTMFKFKHIYGQVFIAALLTNIFVLVAPIFIMTVYDRVVPNYATTTLWVLAAGAFTFFAFDFVARMLRSYLVDLAGKRSDMIMSAKLYQKLLDLKMEYKPSSTGGFATIFHEFETLRDFFTSATMIALVDIPFIFLFLVAIWYIGGPIVWIPVLAIPIVLISAVLLEIPSRRAVNRAMAGSTSKQAILVETVGGLEAIKAASAESAMQKKWEHSVMNNANAATKTRFYGNLVMNITVWVQQIVTIGIIIVGVYLIMGGKITIGGLIAVTILGGRALMLGPIAGLLTRAERSIVALKSLNNLMDLPTERGKRKKLIRKPVVLGNIEGRELSFYYPDQRIPAVDDASFNIKAGERVGIIGRIGAGKSTLLKMMVGLYSPTSGNLFIDGTDIDDADMTDIRQNVQYVGHDSSLFYGSVRDNITLANPSASDDDLLTAAKIAGVDVFCANHPDGFDMQIGERGEHLSGGQRQAVALARAFLSRPSVLLLDEPTGSVDNQYEKKLMDALRSYLQGKTLVLVTHRASLLALVDRVIVMERGKIVADGPKDIILEKLGESQTIKVAPNR